MSNIDPTSLLKPVSEDAPCGPNMEYDPAFGELERAAQGTPERVVGDKVVAQAEDPDWARVFDLAHDLLGKTKDLRAAAHLVNAGLRRGGLPQIAHGFAVIRGLTMDYWDAVHPQLDREENDDPTLRMNSLVTLNDRAGVLGALSRCALIQSRALGRVTLRDVRIASGELTAGPNEPPPLEAAHVDAAFMDGDLGELEANAAAARASLAELDELGAFLNERVGAANAPDFSPLTNELRAIGRVLAEQLARRGVGEGAAALAADGVAAAPRAGGVGDIATREDVVRVLDKLCDYFQRHEPSSPVPLLLRRAQRLVAKDFMEILRDLTPDGVQQARLIGGIPDDQ
jgi:type VI secretion system protein ImpA